MADDETTDSTSDATSDADATSPAETPDEPTTPTERGGVHLPAWALVALVVLAALAIGGVGYAIGHSGEDSINLNTPIADLRQAPDGTPDGNTGACPGPMGGFGGAPGGQLPPVPGAPMGPGFHDDGGSRQRDDQQDDQDDNQQDNGQDDQNQDSSLSSS